MWGNDVGAHAIRPARSPSWPGLPRARWHAVRIRADRPSRIVPQRFPATISTFSLPVRAVRRTHRPRPYARCLRPPSPRLSRETRQRRPRVRRVCRHTIQGIWRAPSDACAVPPPRRRRAIARDAYARWRSPRWLPVRAAPPPCRL